MTLESLHRKALDMAAKYQLQWNYEIEVIAVFNGTHRYQISLIPDLAKWGYWQTEAVATPTEALHEFDVLLDENTNNQA